MENTLLKKIKEKTARVCVLGMGRVGLPLATVICSKGYRVKGYDISAERVKSIIEGKNLNSEPKLERLLSETISAGMLDVDSKLNSRQKYEIYIVAVPTPIENGRANLNYLKTALKTIRNMMDGGELVVVESTIPPGASRKVIAPILKEKGLVIGQNLFYAYAPERILPGRMIEELTTCNRVLGCFDETSALLATEFYKRITSGEIDVTSPETAEIVKLIENTYRDVNIALANVIARICSYFKVDPEEAIRIANKHPRVNILKPGIGVGGPCLTKDPLILYSHVKDYGYESPLILEARNVNDEMSRYAANQIDKVIKKYFTGESLKVAILGLSYKGGIGDTANSPAIRIAEQLKDMGYQVESYDPYLPEASSCRNIIECVKDSCCVVIGADHPEFAGLDLGMIKRLTKYEKPVLYDGRYMFRPIDVLKAGFVYVAPGYIKA